MSQHSFQHDPPGKFVAAMKVGYDRHFGETFADASRRAVERAWIISQTPKYIEGIWRAWGGPK